MLRTKEQTKAICSTCPIAKTAHLIGDSCVLLIIRDLQNGSKRFKDFEESLPGVSTRTLTKKLSILLDEKIITRNEYKTLPPKVDYTLTKKGLGLSSLLKAMENYGKKHLL